MKIIPLIVFIVLAIIQWIVPAKMIFDKENILNNGKTFRFQTEPIDPENPFTGKYIYLRYRATEFRVDEAASKKIKDATEIYVLLATDTSGYATIRGLETNPPAGSTDYVKARLSTLRLERPGLYTASIEYPFDEFYMDEFKTSMAETVYHDANRDSTQKTYALVNIWKGKAVIKDIMINDSSIAQVIRAHMNTIKP